MNGEWFINKYKITNQSNKTRWSSLIDCLLTLALVTVAIYSDFFFLIFINIIIIFFFVFLVYV